MSQGACVVVVVPQHWERALIRAELIERGHDVVGLRGLGDLLQFHAAESGHGPIRAVLVDRKALHGRRRFLASILRQRHPGVPFLLLAAGAIDAAAREGSWDEVLARPISVGAIAARIQDAIAAQGCCAKSSTS